MGTRPLSTSVKLDKEVNQAERNYSGMGEDLPAQATNDFNMDLDVCGDLQYADPAVVGPLEPSASSREKVSGIAIAPRTSSETRPLALARFRQG